MIYSNKSLVNIPMLLRVIGWLLMIEAAFMLIPLGTSLFYNERDWIAFAIAAGSTALIGLCTTTFVRPGRTSMGKREGFLLTAMTWIVFSFFGTIPFIIGNCDISLTDAFFEAMSSFTTTGASTLESVENLSHGLLIWRAVMQWIGGLGIILFTLAVIPMLNQQGGMQMFNAEVTGITHEKIRPRVSQTAKGLWSVYILLTSALCVLLIVGPMSVFDSICHSMSVMSTGGISTSDGSVDSWNSPYIKIVMTLFMFLGGVNFSLIYRVGHGDFKSTWKNQVWRVYGVVILAATLVTVFCILLTRPGDITFESIVIDPLFQVVSMITSTGYTLDVFPSWGPVVLLVMIVLMISGGCAGSTSGGAKIDRFIVLFQHCRNEIERCLHPNAILSVRSGNRVVPRDLVSKSIVFLCLFALIIIAGTFILTTTGAGISHSFMLTMVSITNAGISLPDTIVNTDFSAVADLGKWVLSLIMLVGRLEIFTVLLLFTPEFWQK